MDDTAKADAKGARILVKHKMRDGDDPDEQQPAVEAKKSKVDKRRRMSLVRDRRSSRGGGLNFEDETDICNTIPMDIPEENRLQILLQQALRLALNSAFDEVPDPDIAFQLKSKVEASFAAVSEEMFSLETLRAAVAPAKQEVCSRNAKATTEASRELKESLESTKAYIERLKKESEAWDKLKEESAVVNASSEKENTKTDDKISQQRSLEERLERYTKLDEKLDKSRERLLLQLKTIASAASTLKQFEEKATADLNLQTLQLHAATAGEADVRNFLNDIAM